MKIIVQLLKEFWLPLMGAIVWTAVNYFTSNEGAKTWTELVNIVMPSFFFLSWMTGQFFRVKKQTFVSSTLSNIEERVESVLGDIVEQSSKMKLIANTQLFQTFDLCLDSTREVKEELADRNRLFKKEKNINLEQFELYRDNPFYQSKRFLSRLINYAIYTLQLKRENELEERYNRTAYHCEELAGTITTLIGKMNHENLNWKTPKTDSLLNEISDLVKLMKDEIVPVSKYKTASYKNRDLKVILETHIKNLTKYSQ